MPGLQLPGPRYDYGVWSHLRIWYCKLAALGQSYGVMGKYAPNCMVHDNILSCNVHYHHHYRHHCKHWVCRYAPLLSMPLPSYRPQGISSIPRRCIYVLSLSVRIRLV
jgi:hypothetical protein